jgi:Na+/phosphate symporter
VLGANLGTAINPLLESGVGSDPAARRLPIGNLINRVIGCALSIALLDWIGPKLVAFEPDPARAVADFHTGFNLLIAALFLPVLGPFAQAAGALPAITHRCRRSIAAGLSRRGCARVTFPRKSGHRVMPLLPLPVQG